MSNPGPGYTQHPEHRVLVEPFAGRVVVKANGKVLVDTEQALALREASYPVVYYVPRSDTRMAELVPTELHTGCPFKGQASYFSIAGGAENAVWSYEHPYDEVQSIREYLAFYPNRVDAIEVTPSG
jgi:uncharacterized protein (DUF427 family)